MKASDVLQKLAMTIDYQKNPTKSVTWGELRDILLTESQYQSESEWYDLYGEDA